MARRAVIRVLLAALPLILFAAPAEAGPVAPIIGGLVALASQGGIAGFLFKLAGSFVLSALSRTLAPKPKNQGFTAGIQDMVRQPITARRTIYGTQFVSGPIVYVETHGEIDGLPNIYISLILALAGHECEEISEVWFNDNECEFLDDGVTVGDPFSSRAQADPGGDIILDADGIDFAHVYTHLGTTTQTVDARLNTDSVKWTSAHRLRGICYAHVRLRFDRLESLFHDGVPTVRFRIKGKKVLDTRTSTTAWSNNPALCLYDYLTNVLNIDAADIDTASVDAAANVCDENVTIGDGTTQDRYTCDGVFDSDTSPADVINALTSSMAGALIYSGGLFYIYAGAATTATPTLDEDNMMGPVTVWPRTTRRETFNGVKAIYTGSRNWQPTTSPVVTNSTYLAQDNDEEITQTIDLPFTVSASSIRAQRMAKIELERARQQIVVDITTDLTGLQLKAWDTVNLTIARYGWSGKKFRVMSWRLNEEGATVSMTLREEADSMWSWTAASDEQAEDPAPDTNLPNPFDVTPPGTITIVEELRESGGNVSTGLNITLGEVSDGFLDRYECQVRQTLPTTGAWKSLGESTSNEFEFFPVVDGRTYQVRGRSMNAIGARSSWITVTHQVAGQTTPPEDVTNFRVDIRSAEALLSWDAVADLDLAHYRIRWSPLTSGAAWSSAVDLVAKVARPATSVTVPTLTGTYLIKAVDLKGNESENATSIVSTVSGVAGLNVIETLTENPTFAGTHSSTVAVEGALKLDTTNLWDSGTGNVDDMTGLVDGGGGTGNVASSGTYTFANSLDLGAVYTSRLTASLQVTADDYTSLFDDTPGDFDDRDGLFDGAVIADVNAYIEVRTTLDDPGGAPSWEGWRPFVVGDYRARAFQFRCVLTSANANASPSVSALSVTVDMEDRIVEEHDVASGAGADVVTFPGGGFRAVPAIGISAQGLATGDYYEITSKSATGFTITFRNAGGTAVDRTYDYIAKGYGLAA